MSSPAPKRIVGIDLGTTNTVVAWTDPLRRLGGAAGIEVFPVEQLVGQTEVEPRALLPSYLYAPIPGEIPPDLWGDAPYVIGSWARRRGAEVSGRATASAKSWLSYAAVDRTAAILPWGIDDEDAPKISPLDASARVLGHVKAAWDTAYPEHPLAEQQVILTVPASFEEDARRLTREAAERAGLSVRLLEEPQAAFYDHLSRAGADPEMAADPGQSAALRDLAAARGDRPAMVLVVDVGGGTTDLSLLSLRNVPVSEDPHGVVVTRVAVGQHLLLGGDNMDLTLAHACEAQMGPPSDSVLGGPGPLRSPPPQGADRLDPARFSQLVLACRAAKETLLGEAPPTKVDIAVAGRGSRLVGNTLRAEISADQAHALVLDGFFPDVPASARPQRGRTGLVAFGLPYERDPAITRHIAAFLHRHREALGDGGLTAVLLNGGVFRAPKIVRRLLAVLDRWNREQGLSHAVLRLGDIDPDLAVARGAVVFGLTLSGLGIHIRGGSARGFYIGLPEAPGQPRQGVCLVPRGAREGIPTRAEGRTFALTVGRPVRFDLFTSDTAKGAPGDLAVLDEEVFEQLPPLAVRFDRGAAAAAGAQEVKVALEAELSPIGTLDVSCVETGNLGRTFALAFQLRDAGSPAKEGETGADKASVRRSVRPARLDPASESIRKVFGKSSPEASPREVKDLVRDLEKACGERQTWTLDTTRALFDLLIPHAPRRKRSADHERQFWLLVGFCLRPGFGAPGDEARAAELAPLFAERLAFEETRSWQQFWIAWRRVAGGLSEAHQLAIRDTVDPFFAPAEKKLKKPKGWKIDAEADMLDMAACLERIPPARKVDLGSSLLEKTWTSRDPRWWAAVGRIGSRVPAYASVHQVVSPFVAEKWVDQLLRDKWEDLPTAPGAAVSLARVTADRGRDLAESVRMEVEKRLVRAGARESWIRAVREPLPIDESDRAQFFGEALPVGVRLLINE